MAQENAADPIFLTVKEVTDLLRIQRPKVYDLIKSEVLDGFKVGSDWRITRESVEKIIRRPIPDTFFKK
ncbi:MAG: helix-turn-helix domain-containing protein [Bdellovibrionota bacterium]|jgi:excisionase family DNA binding protein